MVELIDKEGADIAIPDMLATETEPSQIQRYFSGSTIFITGGTGFLGKLIIEKLLRSCKDIKKIYMLIRSKKGKSTEKRFEELFENVVWERLKKERPEFIEKISFVIGDCSRTDLGLNDEDRQKLINEVDCVFHVAATVRFDEKIRTATYINVRGTRDILLLSKEIKQLRSFVYVSTAYSHCTRKEIYEEFYEPIISGDKLITLVDALDEEMLASITPTILGEWPNTYALTKSVAEDVVKSYSHNLPVAIIRPSIVISTAKDPIAGWIDNVYGATGVMVGTALGLIRTLQGNPDCRADMVPADYVINCAIAAAWDIGTRNGLNNNNGLPCQESDHAEMAKDREIPIYNYVCSTQKPITWREFNKLAELYLKQIPSPLLVWSYCFIMTSNYYLHVVLAFLLHTVPAYAVDFIALCLGKKRLMVKGYQKIGKFLRVISYFATREWNFHNVNTQALWKKLNKEDREDFEFDMSQLDWSTYFHTYARGARVYLCKDPLETVQEGCTKYARLQIAHYTLCTVLLLIFVKCIMMLWNCFV